MRRLIALMTVALISSVGLSGAAHATNRTIVVPRDYPTIQAAVDAAAPGDTINVKSGTYTEEVVIGKDLTLRGAGAGATIIQSPPTLTPYAVNTRNNASLTAVVRVGHGAHVRMSGLTVSGVPCGVVESVVVVQAATLDFSNAQVRDTLQDASCLPPQDSRAIGFGLPGFISIEGANGSTAFGRVNNVAIDNYQDIGLAATGPFGVPPTSVTFTNNVITAGNSQLPVEQFSIAVNRGAKAQVTGNTVTGGVCTLPGCGSDPINEFQAAGVFVVTFGAGTTISENHISGNDIGVYQLGSANCCTISDNTLQDNRFFGIAIQDGDGTTRDNTISGGQVGIGVIADGVDTTGVLRGDSISGTTVAPVREIECCGFTATAIVKK